MKKTLVIGASDKPDRYAFKATVMLREYNHEVVPFGLRKGQIQETPIKTEWPEGETFDTVTLYVNPTLQKEYEERILALRPVRVVFNPGTENPEFEAKLMQAGIQALEACTLVLLRTNNY